jgi:hypothetical protein
VTEVIVFPDVEQILGDWLAEKLAARGSDVPVGTRAPDPRPASFITLKRTGGPRANLVTDAALITVESWADQESAAHDLAQLVRGLLNSAAGQVTAATVYRVRETAGPGSLPDPVSPQARYSQTFEIRLRGTAA